MAIGLGWLVAGAPLVAQHSTAQDIDDGGRVFRNTCANCHGPDGDEVAGIDLGRGVFRRAKTDPDLVQIIRSGVPGTAMPASEMSVAQAEQIVAYLRSMAATKRTASAAGNLDRGGEIFHGKGACTTCHRVNGLGARLGPDLSDIGQLRRAAELETSIVDPGKEILSTNRTYRVVTKSGTTVTGHLLNLDSFTVLMLDTKEQLRSFEKANLRDYGFVDASPMPSYKDKLTAQELADLVSYLVSLKGKVTP
ncbi:MAG TPA: c-type cytochrome [Vicinamibacterales bacterium]|nr:c-type cytochrome [Vicinamibacterales bacterium]